MLPEARKLSRMYLTMQTCIINVTKVSTNAVQVGHSLHEHKQPELSRKVFETGFHIRPKLKVNNESIVKINTSKQFKMEDRQAINK